MAKAKQLASGNWRVLLYIGMEDGQRKYKSFTAETKREAEYLAAEYAAHPKKEKASDSMTLGEAIDRYIAVKEGVLSPKTVREYRRFRRLYAQNIMDIRIQDLTTAILQGEVSRESLRLSPKSVRNVYGLLSATLGMFQPDVKYRVMMPQKVKRKCGSPRGTKLRKSSPPWRGRSSKSRSISRRASGSEDPRLQRLILRTMSIMKKGP